MTPADLARILAQPGYSVDDPLALLPSTAAQEGQGDDLPAQGIQYTKNQQSTLLGRSTQPWRNEWEFQSAVIYAAKLRAGAQTEYAMLVAIPNGQYRKGQRAEAGLTAGMPDLMLCVTRDGYGALFIELKCGRNKPNRAQLDMHHRLRMEGYKVAVVWDSVAEVMRVIEEYLGEEN